MSDVNGVNLAPQWRKLAARRAVRCRFWLAGCTAYAAVLILAYGVCYGQWHGADNHVREQLTEADKRIDEIDRVIARTVARLAQSRLDLRVNRVLSERPDWSVVLRLVAGTLGDDLVLRECKLVTTDDRSTGGPVGQEPPSGSRALTLNLRGHARSQASISRYALRLEQTSLFDKVTVLETRREPFLTGESVAFSVTCSIRGTTTKP